MKILPAIVIASLLFIGFGCAERPVLAPEPAPVPEPVPAPPPSKQASREPRDVTYLLINGETTPVSYFGNEARGDIDGDGTEDVAFLVTVDKGGSGTFFYVAAILNTTPPTRTDALFLGDRIAPQTTEVRSGSIIVNYAERAAGEPMTSRPSVGVSRRFEVEGGMLVEPAP